MTSKTRIQNYLRENMISELFEEMMGKLIRDLPASPIYYLANFLHEKEKKVKQIVRDVSSPNKDKKHDISENAQLWATTPNIKKQSSSSNTASSPNSDGRKYEKPWLTHSKKSFNKSKSGSKLSKSLPIDSKSEKADDVVDGDDWADLGLIYATPKIVGDTQVKSRSAEEEMESELSASAVREKVEGVDDVTSSNNCKLSAKDAKRKRLEELIRLTDKNKSELSRSRSPLTIDEEEEEALEVLEDADELMSEGVKNPPKTGVIVGRSSDKEKEQIELVLNMSKFFDELGGMEGLNQGNMNGGSSHSPPFDDDDDFESASQVTGPRRPVWDAPDTEVESVASQLKSARNTGIGIDSFLEKPGSATKSNEKSKTKSHVSNQKSPSPRPHTAPPKSNSDVNGSQGPKSPKKPSKSPRSRPTTPKGSRPATPRGSQFGSGRASRRMSQASNLSVNHVAEKAKSENGNIPGE